MLTVLLGSRRMLSSGVGASGVSGCVVCTSDMMVPSFGATMGASGSAATSIRGGESLTEVGAGAGISRGVSERKGGFASVCDRV